MARGRPDYWYGSLPGKAWFAPGQSQWLQRGTTDQLAYPNGVDLIDYTVPADTILVVSTGFFSSSMQGRVRIIIDIGGAQVARFSIDSFNALPLNMLGIYQLAEGETIKVEVKNISAWTGESFHVTLVGYEEVQTQ